MKRLFYMMLFFPLVANGQWTCSNYLDNGMDMLYQLGPKYILSVIDNEKIEADYHREGLTYRWDWGDTPGKYDYAFIIKPDGLGLYYDFRTVKGTDKVKAVNLFKCKKN